MTFHQQITDFFAAYVDAFARSDADAISQAWDETALFPAPGGNFAMPRPAFREHCVALLEFYRRHGVVRPEAELLTATELFPNVAQARLAYRMRGAGGEVIAGWEHVYILRRTGGWRISLTIADGEMAAWAALGAHP